MLGEAVHVEPLRAEFLREPPRLRVMQHPPRLGEQHLRLVQPPGRGHLQELGIGQRRPEEITQSRGQFGIAHRLRPRPRPRRLRLIKEGGGHEHAGEREGEGLLVRQVVAAEFGIELVQFTRLLRAERPPVGLRGEGLQLRQLQRLGVGHLAAEGGGPGLDRLTHRRERLHEIGPVLRGVSHQLLVNID